MEFWEPTQQVLQGEIPLVKRPKLTDALLRKPPFRFLHDVISELCRQTGYAKGLFTSEELISTNVKDKESKVMYLQKIIDCVGVTLHASVPVRPVKIVAGLEPEQTNVFLQMLAAATMMDKEISDRAVTNVLAGKKQPPSGQGGTQWIQLLKQMIPLKVSHSHPTLQQPLEASEQHSTAKKHHSPAKRASNQNINKEHIATVETTTSCKVPVSQIEHNSRGLLEQRDESPKPSKKASKQPTLTTKISSKSPTRSSQLHESKTTTLHGNISNPINSQSQRQSTTSSVNHKADPKENSPTKRCHSKPTISTSAGKQQKKMGSATSKVNDVEGLPTSDVVPYTTPCIAEEARSSNVALTNIGDINNDYENEGNAIFQHQGEVNVFAMAPTNQEGSLFLKDAGAREEKCTDNILFRETTPPLIERVVPAVEPRPLSARKAPPATECIFEKGGAKFMQGTSMERPTSVMQSGRKPNIFIENELKDEDEQDNMPVLLPPQAIQETILSSIEGAGKLIGDILESKENFEDEESIVERDEKTSIILGQIRGSLVRKGDKQTKQEEIQKLKEAVQTLCQTASPLGKSMDYLQEDVETMSKEYNFWVKERDLYNNKLEEEKR
ncbi:unnamed protein product [Calypogeia fissa]